MRVFVNDASLIKIGTPGSVGIDVYAKSMKIDWRHGRISYDTGLIAVPETPGVVIDARARSSISKKYDIIGLTNGVGTIDNDYTGTIKFVFAFKSNPIKWLLHVTGIKKLNVYYPGERIGQLVVIDTPSINIVEKKKEDIFNFVLARYGDKARLSGGFGSTGDK